MDVRKKLFEGGKAAVDAAERPDDRAGPAGRRRARAVRKRFENEVEEPKRQAYAAIAKAKFALDGDKTYPDATFTLRLAFGTVKGYRRTARRSRRSPPSTGCTSGRQEHGNKGAVRAAASGGWRRRTSST